MLPILLPDCPMTTADLIARYYAAFNRADW